MWLHAWLCVCVCVCVCVCAPRVAASQISMLLDDIPREQIVRVAVHVCVSVFSKATYHVDRSIDMKTWISDF